MKIRTYAPALVLTLVVACSPAEPSATVTVYASPAQISAEAAPSAETSASSSPSPAAALLPLGDGFGTGAGAVLTPSEATPVNGLEWAQYAVHVQACLGEDAAEGLTVGPGPWSVRTADGGVYPAQLGALTPETTPGYPLDEPIAPGECLRGWMTFNTGTAVPTELRYRNAAGDTAGWELP